MQVDSFAPAHSAFGFPIYVAPLPAGSIPRACYRPRPWLISSSLDVLDVLIGGGGEKDTTIISSLPIAYSIVCSARAKPGGSYSRAWARAYGHFVFAIRLR